MKEIKALLTYQKLDKKLFYTIDNKAPKEITNWHELKSEFGQQILPASDLNNQEVILEVEESIDTKGKPKLKLKKIIVGRKQYGREFVRPAEKKAKVFDSKAPYNFVPINDLVVPFQDNSTHDNYDLNLHSGYIVLHIETITPIFIRGEGNKNLLIEGKPILPGSSLRGMVRNLVEICSYSKMKFFNDKRLFFRSFDSSNLQKKYTAIQTDTSAGFLFFDPNSKEYFIKEAANFPIRVKGNHWEKFAINEVAGKLLLTPGLFNNGRATSPAYEFTISYKEDDIILLSKEDVEAYKEDDNRDIGMDILTLAKEDKYQELGVPIFFIKQNNGVIFGHTKFFRVPYNHSIGEHIPTHKSSEVDKSDIVDAIFGNEINKSSKVFFEEAICLVENSPFLFDEEVSLKILNSPKPTTFQHYLEQPNGEETPKDKLKNWDDVMANIRGFKQYWHRNTPDEFSEEESWRLSKVQEGGVYSPPIIPIKRNINFKANIRFENLSDVELGALLFVLDLPTKNHHHKIGLGKPLGLGSVKINPELIIFNRENRYKALLNDEGSWEKSETKIETKPYKEAFELYILTNLKRFDKTIKEDTLWKIPRLKMLLTMLNFNHTSLTNWNEETRYLEIERIQYDENGIPLKNDKGKIISINEYKNRPVLPKPDEIINT